MRNEHFPPPSEPPPWIVSRPPPPPGLRPSRWGSRALLATAATAIAVLLILGTGGAWWLLRSGDTGQQPSAAEALPDTVATAPADNAGAYPPPVEESTPDLPTAEPGTGAADPQAVALDRLEETARQGLAAVVLDGRYVAQLASKNPGTHDPLQTTASGSHTFQATDILEEYERLRSDPANGDARVVLLRSDQYGKRQLLNGEPFYVTFALRDFSGAADVRAWCAQRFPDLSTTARDNQCAVRRLRSPA